MGATHSGFAVAHIQLKKQKQFDHIRLISLDRFSSCFSCQNNCCLHIVSDFDIPLSN